MALDFAREPSGGAAMVEPLSDEDNDPPDDAEAALLIALWAQLDRASETSELPDVMARLDEVLAHIEAAAAVIRQ
jgi:hypothetical protein